MTSLIACGGTGAHVTGAFLRLHTLAYPLGYLRNPDQTPLTFPSLYLVDQDHGDGDGHTTAWQLAKELAHSHPGQQGWNQRETLGHLDPIRPIDLTPLPVGREHDWYSPPNVRMTDRFGSVGLLKCLTTERQQALDFSKGMMGSPALGSLLFRLKEYDKGPDGGNNERRYDQLFNERGRIVVVGSAIGGTGASVIPTLAAILAECTGNDVMAIPVLQWFKLGREGLDQEGHKLAKQRANDIAANANTALAAIGQVLSHKVATVPVGVRESEFVTRQYSSDNQQPLQESFVHTIASLCAMSHFLEDSPYSAGLYQMGAATPSAVSDGTVLPGVSLGTMRTLADDAQCLSEIISVVSNVMTDHKPSWIRWPNPALYDFVSSVSGSPSTVGSELMEIGAHYRKQVEWIEDVLSIKPKQPQNDVFLDRSLHAYLKAKNVQTSREPNAGEVARALFHWIGQYVQDRRKGSSAPKIDRAIGGYWPSQVSHGEGVTASTGRAGKLTKIPEHDIEATLATYIDKTHVTHNGWPSHVASLDHFSYQIRTKDQRAQRKLQLLFLGLITGDLETKRHLNQGSVTPSPSLEWLAQHYKETEGYDFATVWVVKPIQGSDPLVLGFNSPLTLLCPIPDDDQHIEADSIWKDLWHDLTGQVATSTWYTKDLAAYSSLTGPIQALRQWMTNTLDRISHEGGPGAPAWTRALQFNGDTLASHSQWALSARSSGVGELVIAKWGQDEPYEPKHVWLPSIPASLNPGTLDTNTEIDSDSLLETIKLSPEKIIRYPVPGATEAQGIWEDDLEWLQRKGLIADRCEHEGDVFILCRDHSRWGRLKDTSILRLADIGISDVHLHERDRQFRGTYPDICYPDLPIRPEYLGLVETSDHAPLLDRLSEGRLKDNDVKKPTRTENSIKWSVDLKGRSTSAAIEVAVSSTRNHAHWMVWPSFRKATLPAWKAYYLYLYCERDDLTVDVLWLDAETGKINVSKSDTTGVARALRFKVQGDRAHVGGPPIALAVRQRQQDPATCQGIYFVNLHTFSDYEGALELGVDFGTSHTVAAIRSTGDSTAEPIEFKLEDSAADGLTHHVCEDPRHAGRLVMEGATDRPVLDSWLPTYDRISGAGRPGAPSPSAMLPSEILTMCPLDDLLGEKPDLALWVPGTDYTIPSVITKRRQVGELIADFKWTATPVKLKGREDILREIYLTLFLELTIAEHIRKHRVIPTNAIQVTFTYPLRSAKAELDDFRVVLGRVLRSCEQSMGIKLALKDDVGPYSESKAAKGGTLSDDEVCLVADLGGGTLDLLISANRAKLTPPKGAEFADSAKIGANLLLRSLSGLLPESAGWDSQHPEICMMQLRSWMRTRGSAALFTRMGEPPSELKELGLRGFSGTHQDDANAVHKLLNRYFGLLVEFMARSIVAYLEKVWCPAVCSTDWSRLEIIVQLRGNGWRVWPLRGYRQIEELVKRRVVERAQGLWVDMRAGPAKAAYSFASSSFSPSWRLPSESVVHPKVAPILEAVGKSEEPSEDSTYSHSLIDLTVVGSESQRKTVDWMAQRPFRLPFPDGKVRVDQLAPSLVLTSDCMLNDLEDDIKRLLNSDLQSGEIREEIWFDAPVAALVWEAVFRSARFDVNSPAYHQRNRDAH